MAHMRSGRLPRHRVVYRSLSAGGGDRIGCGFMDKSGSYRDFVDADVPNWSIVVVVRGRGSYRDERGSRGELGPGSVFQRRPGIRHTHLIDPASGWFECFVDLGSHVGRGLRDAGLLRDEPALWTTRAPERFIERLEPVLTRLDEASEHTLPQVMAETIAIAIDLQSEALAQPDDQALLVERACRYLAEDFAGDRSLQRWCAEHELGYERLRKVFQRRTGSSPHRYRIRRRLDEACRLLSGTDLAVAAIAKRLGYPSPFEFSAQFKRHIGVPPSRFRGG